MTTTIIIALVAVVIALSVRLVSLTADRDVQKANAANCTKQMEEL